MAAKSNNKYDVYFWIRDKVIPSCITIQQNLVCDKLIRQFEKVYKDYDLSRELTFICIGQDCIVIDKSNKKKKK